MFQTFSGSSRRAREVNLSGRSAGRGKVTNPSAAGAQHAIAHAQQERLLRQRERDRLLAARSIQRVWRGYRTRKVVKAAWREQFDALMRDECPGKGKGKGKSSEIWDDHRLREKLRLLLRFLDISSQDDLHRLELFVAQFLGTVHTLGLTITDKAWRSLLIRLGKVTLDVLAMKNSILGSIDTFLSLLIFLARTFPEDVARISQRYYQVLSEVTQRRRRPGHAQAVDTALLVSCLLAPLQTLTSKTLDAYESFVWNCLTTPDLPTSLGNFEPLAANLNYPLLIAALATSLPRKNHGELDEQSEKERFLWLLAFIIYVRRLAHGDEVTAKRALEPDYLTVVGTILSALAEDIGARIDVETPPAGVGDVETAEVLDGSARRHRRTNLPLPPFVRHEILSLLDQRNITNLLAGIHKLVPNRVGGPSEHESKKDDVAMTLAGYILTLLRIFPRRADDIRMWLYLGSTSVTPADSQNGSERVSGLKFLWRATQDTEIFKLISRDPRKTVDLVRSGGPSSSGLQGSFASGASGSGDKDREWRVILVFLELYSFVLKVIDDDEFFSGTPSIPVRASQQGSSWTRESVLPLEDLKDLTVFLKNLGFAMHWYASEIVGVAEPESGDALRNYFNNPIASAPLHQDKPGKKSQEAHALGIKGMTIDYVRGTVTGVLRMLYERDSRRKFLPRDHWLMPLRLDMEAFIPAVVMEEERRHSAQDGQDEGDEQETEDFMDDMDGATEGVIGATHARQTRSIEARRMQQLKSTRKKYLELVTPRMEILQNMPYLIPFDTRVRIFREFVSLDQTRRRGGFIDPDHWRGAVMSTIEGRDLLVKHHAKISRESVFEDAYNQFYQLGNGLKEPIQITFVDQFGAVEAGIDGGGVTKEFLTSVTKEAFSTSHGMNLFVENDTHLLYPNPAAVDERKDLLQQAGIQEGSSEWNEHLRDLLRRYEFLGRIIGKCMYEGILVNVAFAPFFLVKWALTGGTGSASGETSYRANLNDLRDLDESLYQGLLQLKYYPENVEDFALNFTITDTISTPDPNHADESSASVRTITRELKPNGANIPVTNQNRLVYISYVARHRLQNQPRLQTNAFLRGLGEIIQPSWLSMFNQAELQTLISGDASEIDVSDLRRHTNYGGVYVLGDDRQEHPSVQYFWEVMNAFSDSDRRKVLQFVTSTPRAPLLGFGQLNPYFSIRDAGDDQERLPSTSTCVNLLKLPRYQNAKTLREKLLYAINSGAGFDLS